MGLALSVLVFSVGVLEALSALEHARRSYLPLDLGRKRRRLVLDIGSGTIRHRETRRPSELQRDPAQLLRRLSRQFTSEEDAVCDELVAIWERVEAGRVHSTEIQDGQASGGHGGEESTDESTSSSPDTVICKLDKDDSPIDDIDIPLDNGFCPKCVDERFDILANTDETPHHFQLGVEGACKLHDNDPPTKKPSAIYDDYIKAMDNHKQKQKSKDLDFQKRIKTASIEENQIKHIHERCDLVASLETGNNEKRVTFINDVESSLPDLVNETSSRASLDNLKTEDTQLNTPKDNLVENNPSKVCELNKDDSHDELELHIDEGICLKCVEENFDRLASSEQDTFDFQLGSDGRCPIHGASYSETDKSRYSSHSHENDNMAFKVILREPSSDEGALKDRSKDDEADLHLLTVPKTETTDDDSDHQFDKILDMDNRASLILNFINENATITQKIESESNDIFTSSCDMHVTDDENYSLNSEHENVCSKCIDENFDLIATIDNSGKFLNFGVEGACHIHNPPNLQIETTKSNFTANAAEYFSSPEINLKESEEQHIENIERSKSLEVPIAEAESELESRQTIAEDIGEENKHAKDLPSVPFSSAGVSPDDFCGKQESARDEVALIRLSNEPAGGFEARDLAPDQTVGTIIDFVRDEEKPSGEEEDVQTLISVDSAEFQSGSNSESNYPDKSSNEEPFCEIVKEIISQQNNTYEVKNDYPEINSVEEPKKNETYALTSEESSSDPILSFDKNVSNAVNLECVSSCFLADSSRENLPTNTEPLRNTVDVQKNGSEIIVREKNNVCSDANDLVLLENFSPEENSEFNNKGLDVDQSKIPPVENESLRQVSQNSDDEPSDHLPDAFDSVASKANGSETCILSQIVRAQIEETSENSISPVVDNVVIKNSSEFKLQAVEDKPEVEILEQFVATFEESSLENNHSEDPLNGVKCDLIMQSVDENPNKESGDELSLVEEQLSSGDPNHSPIVTTVTHLSDKKSNKELLISVDEETRTSIDDEFLPSVAILETDEEVLDSKFEDRSESTPEFFDCESKHIELSEITTEITAGVSTDESIDIKGISSESPSNFEVSGILSMCQDMPLETFDVTNEDVQNCGQSSDFILSVNTEKQIDVSHDSRPDKISKENIEEMDLSAISSAEGSNREEAFSEISHLEETSKQVSIDTNPEETNKTQSAPVFEEDKTRKCAKPIGGSTDGQTEPKIERLRGVEDDVRILKASDPPDGSGLTPIEDIASPSKAFWLIFSGEYTKAMNKDWHSGHFCCWQCDESLTGQRYVLRDEHPYCIKCYEQVFANTCDECSKVIGIDSKDLSYKDKHWHEACFLCSKCRVSLVDKQFGSKADKIYCGNCYDAQFASRCDGCGQIFRAGTKKMEYKTRQWHEQCFCCVVCKTPIGTKSFIPREQEIFCAGCYEEKFATRCVKCNKIITSGGVTYKNEPWHRECFTCTNCSTSLAGQRFTSRDEKPYCADCFGELFAKRCTACTKPITGIGGTRFISFEDRHWHNDCFICAACRSSLVGRGFITDAEDILCTECAKQKLM